jgi:molybdenum cofactor biosynthesis protein B
MRILASAGFEVAAPEVVPDSEQDIVDALEAAVVRRADVVITTGGTGLGPRDVTPQATSTVIEFEVPGIAETMRRAGAATTPMAALSRGIAGAKGAAESLEAVMPVLAHAIRLLHGDTSHD